MLAVPCVEKTVEVDIGHALHGKHRCLWFFASGFMQAAEKEKETEIHIEWEIKPCENGITLPLEACPGAADRAMFLCKISYTRPAIQKATQHTTQSNGSHHCPIPPRPAHSNRHCQPPLPTTSHPTISLQPGPYWRRCSLDHIGDGAA